MGALRQLFQHNGWFSNNKLRYLEFSRVKFVQCYTYSGFSQSNVFNPQYSSLPQSVVEKSMIFQMPDLDQSDFVTIFKQHNAITNNSGHSQTSRLARIMNKLCTALGQSLLKYRKEL